MKKYWILISIFVFCSIAGPTGLVLSEVHFGPIDAVREVGEELDERVKNRMIRQLFEHPSCNPRFFLASIGLNPGCPVPEEIIKFCQKNAEQCLGIARNILGTQELARMCRERGFEKYLSSNSLQEIVDNVQPFVVKNNSGIRPEKTNPGEKNNFRVTVNIGGLNQVESDGNEITVRLKGYGGKQNNPVVKTTTFGKADLRTADAGCGSSSFLNMTIEGGKFEGVPAPSISNSPSPVTISVDFADDQVPDITEKRIGSIDVKLPRPTINVENSSILPDTGTSGTTQSFEAKIALKNLDRITTDNNQIEVTVENFNGGGTDLTIRKNFDSSEISLADTVALTLSGDSLNSVTVPSATNSPHTVKASVDFPGGSENDIKTTKIDQIVVSNPNPTIKEGRSGIDPFSVFDGRENDYKAEVFIDNLDSITSDGNVISVNLVNFDRSSGEDVTETATFDGSEINSGGTISLTVAGGNFSLLEAPSHDSSPYVVEAGVDFKAPGVPDINRTTFAQIQVRVPQPSINHFFSSVRELNPPILTGNNEPLQVNLNLESLDLVESDNNTVILRIVNYSDGTSTDLTRTKDFDASEVQPDNTIQMKFDLFSPAPAAPTVTGSYDVEVDVDFTDDELNDIKNETIDSITVN